MRNLTNAQLQEATRDDLLAYIDELRKLCGRAGEAVEHMTFVWDGGRPFEDFPEKKANTLLNDLIDGAGSYTDW